jgi:hypothetical protein
MWGKEIGRLHWCHLSFISPFNWKSIICQNTISPSKFSLMISTLAMAWKVAMLVLYRIKYMRHYETCSYKSVWPLYLGKLNLRSWKTQRKVHVTSLQMVQLRIWWCDSMGPSSVIDSHERLIYRKAPEFLHLKNGSCADWLIAIAVVTGLLLARPAACWTSARGRLYGALQAAPGQALEPRRQDRRRLRANVGA